MPSSFPFIHRDGISVKYAKRISSGTIKGIRLAFEKNFLDDIDTSIMLHLQKYNFLNAFLIRVLMEKQLETCTAEFCNNRLKKLEKLGFIIRFQFTYPDEKGTEHCTPFVYGLSANARKLFPVRDDKSYVNNYLDIDYVQRRLAYNQFHIMLEKQYDTALLYSSYVFGKEYDGLYKLLSNGKPVIFYVIAIRSTPGWEKAYIDRLREFKKLVLAAGLSFSGIIVITENEYQSLKAERSRSGDKEISEMDVYYVCDYAAVKEGAVLQHVIYVKPEHNYSNYDIIHIHVDGHIKENVTLKAEYDKKVKRII